MTAATDLWVEWLPYGDSFRFVDEVVEIEMPRRLVSRTHFGRREALVQAHRIAAEIVVPGVLLAEQAAQSAFLLGRFNGWLGPQDAALLGRLNCTFERPVSADAVVEAEVAAQVQGGDLAGFRADLRVSGESVARIILAVKNLGPRHP